MNAQILIMTQEYMLAEKLKGWIDSSFDNIDIIGMEYNCALGMEKFRFFLPQIVILDTSMVLIKLQDFIYMLGEYSDNFYIILLDGSVNDSLLPHVYQNIQKTKLDAALLSKHILALSKLLVSGNFTPSSHSSLCHYNENYHRELLSILSNGGFCSKNLDLLKKRLTWKLASNVRFLMLYPTNELKSISCKMLQHMQGVLDANNGGVAFLNPQHIPCLIINSPSVNSHASLDSYGKILQELQSTIIKYHHAHFVFFFGDELPLNNLDKEYHILLQYYRQGFFCKGISSVYFRTTKPNAISHNIILTEEMLSHFFLSLFQESKEQFAERLENIYMKTLKHSFSLETCFYFLTLLELLLYAYKLIYPAFFLKRENVNQIQQAFQTNYTTLEDEYQQLSPLLLEMNTFSQTHIKRPNSLIVQAIIYCIIHCSEAPSQTKVATAINITPTYLSHLFKKECNIVFSDFQMNLRITLAKRLIASTEQKIFQIAENCGFSDYRYFCNTFRKKTTFTPSEYRSRYSLIYSRIPKIIF